jgi:hypothetical protein
MSYFLNPEWVMGLRNPFLETYFGFSPYLPSKFYFYLSCVALGLWLFPRKKVSYSLAFLIPFVTAFSCLLKNIFAMPHPPEEWLLIQVEGPFGFPSGDMLLATVFWGMLALSFKSISLRSVALLMAIMVALSRIYLGGHTLLDVSASMIIGCLMLMIWNMPMVSKLIEHWWEGKQLSYWFIWIFTWGIYALVTREAHLIQPAFLKSFGAAIGLGLAIPIMSKVKVRLVNLSIQQSVWMIFGQIIFCISGIFIIIAMARTLKYSADNFIDISIYEPLRFCLAMFLIMGLFPYLKAVIFHKRDSHKSKSQPKSPTLMSG